MCKKIFDHDEVLILIKFLEENGSFLKKIAKYFALEFHIKANASGGKVCPLYVVIAQFTKFKSSRNQKIGYFELNYNIV
jgi:hypothetical protein